MKIKPVIKKSMILSFVLLVFVVLFTLFYGRKNMQFHEKCSKLNQKMKEHEIINIMGKPKLVSKGNINGKRAIILIYPGSPLADGEPHVYIDFETKEFIKAFCNN